MEMRREEEEEYKIYIYTNKILYIGRQKKNINQRRTAIITSLAFALSPFVMIWSRTAVSDALLCGTFGLSMLLQWRCYVKPRPNSWVYGWIILGFSILAKGPVAVVLMIF